MLGQGRHERILRTVFILYKVRKHAKEKYIIQEYLHKWLKKI